MTWQADKFLQTTMALPNRQEGRLFKKQGTLVGSKYQVCPIGASLRPLLLGFVPDPIYGISVILFPI